MKNGTALVAVAMLSGGVAFSNGGWPIFRGAQTLDGVAGGQLSDSLELFWTFKTKGPVKSSPVRCKGRVFVGSDDGFVYAIDAATGKEAWSFKTEGAVEAPPLVVGGTVFVGSSDMFLYALDADKGEVRWKYQTAGKVLGAANVSPAAPGGGLCAWSNTALVIVGSYDNKVHCVEAATGKAAWTFETGSYVNGTPALATGNGTNTLAVVVGCDGKLRGLDAANGKQRAEVEVGEYIAGSAAVAGSRAYVGHYGNEVACVDIESRKVMWTFKDRAFPYFSSPAVTDQFILIGGRDKRLHCLEREKGTQVWEFVTRGNVDSSPVVCGDKVVFGSSDGRLYMVGLNNGREIWSYDVGAEITASPAVANGVVVIGAHDGSVYAFGSKKD